MQNFEHIAYREIHHNITIQIRVAKKHLTKKMIIEQRQMHFGHLALQKKKSLQFGKWLQLFYIWEILH